MRILKLTDSFLPTIGGAEVAIHHLAEGLVENGHQVLVGCISASKHPREHRRSYELTRLSMPRGSDRFYFKDLLLALAVARLAARWKPDLILATFTWPTGYAALKLRAIHQKPVLIIAQGADIQVEPSVHYGYRLNPILKKRIEWAVRQADGVIAISEQIEQEYRAIGVQPQRIRRIPNSIDCQQLSSPFAGARGLLDIPEDRPVLLSVGRNHPKKGFAQLLQIVEQVRREIPSVLFIIVGRGVSRLAEVVKQLEIEENVRLYEQVLPAGIQFLDQPGASLNQILPFYKAADFYVLPSVIEGLPVVGIEALAAGLPILAFQSPGACDLIRDGENGRLVPLGDWDQLAQAIVAAIRSSDSRAAMTLKAAERARAFDRREIARQVIDFFNELPAKGKA
jgi:glycosyltransferase involved in cell wall biosynthesis